MSLAVAVDPALRPLDDALAEVAARAAERDQSGAFPADEVRALHEAGLLTAPLPRWAGGRGLGSEPGGGPALLDLLRAVGRASLPLGRLYEGHVNALLLATTFARPAQVRGWANDARRGRLFAVWNTEAADGVQFDPADDGGFALRGAKVFASGAGDVPRPMVTGRLPDGGWQMAILRLDGPHEELVDRRFWQPLGMRASSSHRIDFSGIKILPEDLLGGPEDYHRPPWFTSGAGRFAAVQLGGAEAVFEVTRGTLAKRGRSDDPHQRHRAGEMAIALEGGRLWLERAGAMWDRSLGMDEASSEARDLVLAVHMARTAIERAALLVLEHAERSVGLMGMNRPHPLERLIRDLRMYLRQPAPDQSLEEVGRAALAGHELPPSGRV
jgi:alkylation response protein AidB-like acyl-CoA dehydrogenase